MERRMAGVASGHEGVLAVGFTSSAAVHRFTPEALRSCRSQYPGIALDIRENNAAELIEAVADARLHCGLLRVPVARPPGLKFETLLHEPAVAALPIDHPLLRHATAGRVVTVKLSDLRDDGWILVRRPDAPGLYANLLALCEKQGFKPRIVAEVDRMMTNLNLVAAGAGVSVVPAAMQGLHADAVRYCPLAARSRLDAPLTLVYRADDDSGPTLTFIKLLRQLAAQQPARC
jgi:DNA-binding transcriptional LysR family regulator